jgi:CheY-like chemotaxis protein
MKKLILIADDDREMSYEISGILKNRGYESIIAGDGQAALKLIGKKKIDLLLLDLKMPVMTGFDVLKKLDEKKIKIKTIVLTGNVLDSSLCDEKSGNNEEEKSLLKLADAVINKPYDMKKLLEKIKKYTSEK